MDLRDLCDLCVLHAQLFRHSNGHTLGFVGSPCSVCGNVIERGIQPPDPRGLEQVGTLFGQDRQFIPFTPGTSQLHDPVTHFLPPELVSDIFEMCVEYDGPVIHGPPVDPPEYSPLPLSAVCQAWRRIAFSTPGLWTYMPINLDSKLFAAQPPAGMHPAGYEIARDWLARTGSLPLHIKLSRRRVLPSGDQLWIIEPLFQVIYLVNAYSHHWQHLEITLPKILLGRLAQHLPVGCQPILQTLQIEMTDEGSNPEPYAVNMSGLSPLKVKIDSIAYASLNISWTQLTTLVAGKFYIDELMQVVTNAPQLHFCIVFNAHYRDHPIFSSGYIFTHQFIRGLIFRSDCDDVRVGDFLNLLVLPSLTNLDIETEDTDEANFINSLTKFLRFSSPPLDDLVLGIRDISLTVISELLHQVPSIRHLLLSRHFEPEIWTKLVKSIGRPSPSTGEIFLPKLRYLIIEYPAHAGPSARGWDETVETLKDLISDFDTYFLRDARHITVLFSIARSDRKMADIKIPMRVSNIMGLADVVMAGVPFQVGLEPGPDARIRYLDVLRLRDQLSTCDPDSVYQVDWYSEAPKTIFYEYDAYMDESDVDTDEFDVDRN